MVKSKYLVSVLSLVLLVFIVNFGGATLTTTITLNDTDNFYSGFNGNSVIHLIATVTNDSAIIVSYANFSNFTTTCGNAGVVNFTKFNLTTYNASCNVSDVAANSNFVAGVITTVFAQGNGAPGNVTVTSPPVTPLIILYNMTTPPSPPQQSCTQFGPLTTNFATNVSDFSHVNFVINIQANFTCLSQGRVNAPNFRDVMLLNLTSVNLSTPAQAQKLSLLQSAMNITLIAPHQFGNARIYINSTAFQELNTTSFIQFFYLPFTRLPNVSADIPGELASSSFVSNGFDSALNIATVNLTINVTGFSGYNVSDTVNPIINFTSPNIGTSVSSGSVVVQVLVNGTGTEPSYISISGPNSTIYSYNVSDGTNTASCQNISADKETWNCTVIYAVSSLSDGNNTITVTAYDYGNVSGNSNSSNRTFVVDKTSPAVLLINPVNTLNQTTNQSCFVANFSDGGVGLKNITLQVWYSNGTLYNSTSANKTGAMNSSNISITFLSEGTYIWNYLAVDNLSNSAFNSTNWTITYDKTAPQITSISSGTPSTTAATITWTTDDYANSSVDYGINSSLFILNSNSSTFINGSQSISLSSLAANTLYYCNVTSCDILGNCNTTGPNNFTTSAEAVVVATPISGGTAGIIPYAPLTDAQFNEGHTVTMVVKGQTTFMLGSETHHVGILSVDTAAGTALINVSSVPQQKTMAVGEQWKVNVNGDNYYDVLVTLNNVSTGRAIITIAKINETISSANVGTNANVGETPTAPTTTQNMPQNEGVAAWKYVLVWAAIIIILFVIFWFAFLRGKLKERKINRSIRYSSKND